MLRRLATLLLAISVTVVGLTARPHAAACCVVQQAPMHECCKAAQNLRASSCCRGSQDLKHRTVNSQLQTPQPSLLTVHLGPLLAAPAPTTGTVRVAQRARGLAPPGSLTAQHTSLLL